MKSLSDPIIGYSPPRWYKDAVIYSLDVETFKDSNGDGIGDFGGLMRSCRYLSGLGVNCLWLLPFFPSPNRDNGYDVTDYYGIDHRLGSLGDFVAFMREAHNRGLRVIIDLVLNHTSDQHPWFQNARQGRSSPYHNFYVWRYDPPPDTGDQAIFPPKQKGIWTYDEQARAWYLHRFYKHQPDLNIANPAVVEEMQKVMSFWLELGVSGFRVDAVPFLLEMKGVRQDEAGEQYDYSYLRRFREYISWIKGDAMLLAEADVPRETLLEYFGDDDRMHMLFNFLLNERIFLALARQSAEPIVKSLRETPKPPKHGQWGVFLRNHDELSLSRLSPDEREECFQEFAPEENMRIFNRGIRRRLSPMLGGERKRILLAFSLMFTLPGTPIIWYGEELGMGDDLNQEERNSVRTPMQWSSGVNGGFSSASPEKLIRPVIAASPYGFKTLNVEEQQRRPDSLLNAVERMIRVRRFCPEFGCGQWVLLPTNLDGQVLAHASEWNGKTLGAVHNFSDRKLETMIHLKKWKRGILVDVLGDEERPFDQGQCAVKLEPYGCRWFEFRSV